MAVRFDCSSLLSVSFCSSSLEKRVTSLSLLFSLFSSIVCSCLFTVSWLSSVLLGSSFCGWPSVLDCSVLSWLTDWSMSANSSGCLIDSSSGSFEGDATFSFDREAFLASDNPSDCLVYSSSGSLEEDAIFLSEGGFSSSVRFSSLFLSSWGFPETSEFLLFLIDSLLCPSAPFALLLTKV